VDTPTQRAQHPPGSGSVRGLAQDLLPWRRLLVDDGGVGSQEKAAIRARAGDRSGTGFGDRQTADISCGVLTRQRGLIDFGGTHGELPAAQAEKLAAARRVGSKD
jgi:hypothetical protein